MTISDLQGKCVPMNGNAVVVIIRNGKRYVPVFETMRSIHKYMTLTEGKVSGVLYLSFPRQFAKQMKDKSLTIVAITWENDTPIAKEIPYDN